VAASAPTPPPGSDAQVPPPVSPADRALELVDADPAGARAFAQQALLGGDGAETSRGERVLGMVAMRNDDYLSALRHLRRAVRIGERAGAAHHAAEARMTLSLALAHSGSTDRALVELDRAGGVLTGVSAARLQMQRALILQRLGRLDESLEAYRVALPVLRRANDREVESRLLCDRSVAHVYRGDLVSAAADLARSEQLCLELGHRLRLAIVRQNLGWVAAQRGDIPQALEYYDQAAELYRAHGTLPAVLYRDRCEALLSVCLASEARREAERAVAGLTSAHMHADLAEARLMLAESALAERDVETAAEAARLALREFRRQRRARWEALARYVALKADWLDERPSGRLLAAAVRTSDALASAGWTIAACDARLMAARAALRRRDFERAENLLAEARRVRRRAPAEVRARAWHAEALWRLVGGDRPGAERALRAGMRVIDEHRALIGARELRTHVSGHAVELAALGLRTALAGGRPRHVLAWAERSRAGSLLVRPARPPDDAALAADLDELRRIAGEHERATLGGRDTRASALLQRRLEESIRDRMRRSAGTGTRSAAGAPSARALAAALDDRALVEFVQLDGALHAVTLAAGKASLHAVGPLAPIERELAGLRFALNRLAAGRASAASRAAARRVVHEGSAALDRALLGPVLGSVCERELVVVPTGTLHALPWALLPSCRGRPLVVAPSARLWYEAAQQPHGVEDGDAVFVAGPGLPHAAAEASALAASYERSRLLKGHAARVARVSASLDGASLAHVAAHGRFRADNPLFSSLLLADGPLTVYDLERLSSTPRLLILSACDSGLSAVHPGDELMGLAAAFLTLGTRSIVASLIAAPDNETKLLMLSLHRRLRAGAPPRVALAAAQERIAAGGETGLAAAAGFVCLGVG
jgi:tetratricopeptide (TPR) repeat protein